MTKESTIIKAAQAAHEVNRTYCQAIGDYSQTTWENAPDWQKDSAMSGVRTILDSGGDLQPSWQHDAWMKEKVDAGWVWGETKDANKKTHPCIVPYDQLPMHQQAKDALFITVVCGIVSKEQG